MMLKLPDNGVIVRSSAILMCPGTTLEALMENVMVSRRTPAGKVAKRPEILHDNRTDSIVLAFIPKFIEL